jgi:hypothetical protein
VLTHESIVWTHTALAVLQDSLVQIITPTPTLAYPGGTCVPQQITLSCAEDSPGWLASFDIDDVAIMQAIRLGDPLTLTLNGTDYALCCDGITRARVATTPTLTINAASPILQLGSAWADPVTLGAGMARTVVERLLGQSVTWDLLNWRIPSAVADLEDAPLELARAIVAAVGGRLESRPDGTMRARWRDACDVPDYPTAPVVAALTDASLVSLRESIDDISITNRFRILSDESTATAEAAIHVEAVVDPDDPAVYTIYAYPFPWREITLVHTGDAHTQLGTLAEQTRTCRELIEIRGGSGSVAYPVATLDGWTYQHADLGAVHADGPQITTTDTGYSLVWVDYQTRAWVATATNRIGETIQFLAME